MGRLLLILGLMAGGAAGGFLLTFIVGLMLFGSSPHTGFVESLSLAIVGASCGAVGLPVFWHLRRIRKSRPF